MFGGARSRRSRAADSAITVARWSESVLVGGTFEAGGRVDRLGADVHRRHAGASILESYDAPDALRVIVAQRLEAAESYLRLVSGRAGVASARYRARAVVARAARNHFERNLLRVPPNAEVAEALAGDEVLGIPGTSLLA